MACELYYPPSPRPRTNAHIPAARHRLEPGRRLFAELLAVGPLTLRGEPGLAVLGVGDDGPERGEVRVVARRLEELDHGIEVLHHAPHDKARHGDPVRALDPANLGQRRGDVGARKIVARAI